MRGTTGHDYVIYGQRNGAGDGNGRT
jgi:hypothetical protein